MVKGHITYYLSPFAQQHFDGFVSKSLKNGITRIRNNWYYPIVPLGCYLFIHYWADKKSKEIKLHHRD